jgi:hypothetical protein
MSQRMTKQTSLHQSYSNTAASLESSPATRTHLTTLACQAMAPTGSNDPKCQPKQSTTTALSSPRSHIPSSQPSTVIRGTKEMPNHTVSSLVDIHMETSGISPPATQPNNGSTHLSTYGACTRENQSPYILPMPLCQVGMAKDNTVVGHPTYQQHQEEGCPNSYCTHDTRATGINAGFSDNLEGARKHARHHHQRRLVPYTDQCAPGTLGSTQQTSI